MLCSVPSATASRGLHHCNPQMPETKMSTDETAYQKVGVEAVFKGPEAHRAHVVSQLHNAGVIDAPEVQYLQVCNALLTFLCQG